MSERRLLKDTGYIFRYLRPYRVHVVSLILFLVLASALRAVLPYLTFTVIIDRLLPSNNARMILFFAGLVLAFVLVMAAIQLLQGYLMSHMAAMVSFDIRQSLFRHLQRLSLKFFSARNSGEILERLNTDVVQIQAILTNQMVTIVSSAVQVLFLSLAVFLINWQLALLICGLVAVKTAFLAGAVKRLHHRIHALRQMESDLVGLLQERVSLIRVIQAFAMQWHEKKLHHDESMKIIDQGMDIANTWSKAMSTFFFLMDVVPLGVLWMGSYLITTDALTIGELLAMWTYTTNYMFPIRAIVMGIRELQESFVGVQRVKGYLDEKPEILDPPRPLPPKRIHGGIVFSHVDFSYERDRQILFDVNFHIEAGETVAFVGESGSGKSTITNLLFRFYDPSSGLITMDGEDLRDYKVRHLRRSIGVVFQETDLFRATLRENLAYGVHDSISDEEIMGAVHMSLLDDVVAKLPEGLDTMLEERGANFSGGEKQRIAICRVILKKPSLVIFDEATSALDSSAEQQIQATIDRVMEEPTSILIAHRLSTVVHAKCIYVMREGRIVEQGAHEDLLDQGGEYHHLWEEQLKTNGLPAEASR